MAKSQIQRELAALQSLWEAAVPQHGFTELPEGQYTGKIVAAVVDHSKKGRLQIAWDLKVMAGKHKGKTVKRFSGLETEENFDWLKGDLETLGAKMPKSLEALTKVLEGLADLGVIFKVRQNDEYTNYDFVDTIDADAEEAEEEPEEEPEEEAEEETEEEEDKEKPARRNRASKNPSRADVKAMSEKELAKLAKTLDIDPDDYEGNTKKLRHALIEELGL